MAGTNVDLVRRAIEANRSGPAAETVDACVALVHADVVFTSRLTSIEGAAYRGRDGVRRYFADLGDAFDEWCNEAGEIIELGPDAVLMDIVFRATGKGGVEVELASSTVWVFSAGAIAEVHADSTREAALEAAGRSNADVVLAIADAVGRGDLDALMPLLDEGIEHRDARGSVVSQGRDGIRRHFDDLWRESPGASFSVDEIVEGGDWVVVRQRWRGLADGQLTTWVAREFRDGRVKRIEVHGSRADALEAAGLSD